MTSNGIKARLLAVDDNPDSAELIARIAAKCGYDAKTIGDLDQLKDVLIAWRPSVLTLDLCMPQEDGIGVLSMLKECDFAGQLVIISGQDGWLRKAAARLADARGLKVADDLGKPVDLKALRELLNGLKAAEAA
ncbi:MAG TPA: response regulator [Micropepsaceae bacterium]|nr:response regulator [Micropepsaceae bacterium]